MAFATTAEVIRAALQKILVQASEAPIEAAEAQDAIFALNNLMLALDADGVQLGYTEVTDLSDPVTVPAGALRGVIYNLGIEMAPEFNGTVTPALAAIAAAGMETMRKLGVHVGQTFYPSTLPVGSGNQGFTNTIHFYPGTIGEILAETTGSISLEVDTNSVAEGA